MPSPTVHLRASSPSWPGELNELDGAPDDLWLRGDPAVLTAGPRLAIVGSRGPTPYGAAQAERFAAAFARYGWVIVSGLARGIDQAAHRAALEAGGTTVAVLGCGTDRPWPAGELTERIATEGLLVSEFPPGTPPRRHHFPLRNRILAGLSEAVLVVEAARASGSLITARWAVDQGKTVFALPGRAAEPLAEGTLDLLRSGATPIGSPAQLLTDLRGPLRGEPDQRERPRSAVLEALSCDVLTVDQLANRTASPVGRVLVELIQLELLGLVTRGPGGLYRALER